MRPENKQVHILRLLFTHRLMDIDQLMHLAFEGRTRRACQKCLAKLRAKGLVVRIGLHRAIPDPGGTAYAYALSEQGARFVSEMTGHSLEEIPHESDSAPTMAHIANHQLTVNRCLIPLYQATKNRDGLELLRWNSDPHLRMRCRVDRGWRVVHPDAIAKLRSGERDHWFFFEIDKGTESPNKFQLKIERYARFWLSGAWTSEFPVFPEIRITTTQELRVRRLLRACNRVGGAFHQWGRGAFEDNVYIALARERDFLANPLGAIWTPAFTRLDRKCSLL